MSLKLRLQQQRYRYNYKLSSCGYKIEHGCSFLTKAKAQYYANNAVDETDKERDLK